MLRPEQTLQLQLEVSEALSSQTTRDGIGLALAEVINKIVPFEFFLHSIWMPGATSGYRISSVKNAQGKFEIFHDLTLEEFRSRNFESFLATGQFLSDPANEGIYQGEDLIALIARFPAFATGYNHGIRSMMIFNMVHDNGARHTMVISERREKAFDEDQFQTVKTVFPQIKMAFDNLFNYEVLKRQERDLSLQLEVNNSLVKFRTRDELCYTLNKAIDKAVPFEMGFVRIWSQADELGYFRGYTKDSDGEFHLMEDNPFVKLAEQDSATVQQAGERFAEIPQIIQGDMFMQLSELDASFKLARDVLKIRSTLSMHIRHESTVVQFVLTSTQENAFTEDQLYSIGLLQPQIKLTFENVFSYEILAQKDQERKLQLELNNVLLEHTNREDFALSLAEIINKSVPCERFILRVWEGPVQVGYRIPLKRNDDGTFTRFSDHAIAEYAMHNPEKMVQGSTFMINNPGIFQGESFEKLRSQFPLADSISRETGIQSLMALPFRTSGSTCILALGNSQPVSFTVSQLEVMKMMLPQIILAFENLVKYEKIREEERERNTQLELMTAFNREGDLEEMALEAILKMNEFIPFEFWMQISTESMGHDLYFRLAVKSNGRFTPTHGQHFFELINHPTISSLTFREQNPGLFEKLDIYVGDDFERLTKNVSLFQAMHETLGLNSLAVFPLKMRGSHESVLMMGSIRQYAFSQADLDSLNRILPYISMAAAQYRNLVEIQKLTQQLQLEKNYLVEEIKSNYNFEEIVGSSHVMKEVFKQVAQVAATDSTVLILGETGTGKELIARAIHNQSDRKDKVLVKLNCASLPAQLIESELFGHEKGSFTGALEKRIGKFELADGGTIFLDEMGELPLELQAKLLRVLQEREIERIGGKQTISLDVRIIAATNRQLEDEVAEGRFRSDLFYRLNIFPIHLPPLRERREDIPMLTTHFLQKFTRKMKKPMRALDDATLQYLMNYNWPGNIRELENVLEQSVIVGEVNSVKLRNTAKSVSPDVYISIPKSEQGISEARIEEVLVQTKGKIVGPDGAAIILNMRPAQLEEFERKWILKSLQKCGGRIRGDNGAASLMGMKPTTLEARIQKLTITKAEIFSS